MDDLNVSAPKGKGFVEPPAKPRSVRMGLNEQAIANCVTAEGLLLLLKDSDVVDLPRVGERATVAPPNMHDFVMPPKSPPPIQVRLNQEEISNANTVEELQNLVLEGVIDVKRPKASIIEVPTSPKAVKTLLDRDRVKHCNSIEELRNLIQDAAVEIKPPKVVTNNHHRIKRCESDGGTPFPEGPKPRVQKDTIEDCDSFEDLKKIVLGPKHEVNANSPGGDLTTFAGKGSKTFGRSKVPGAVVKAQTEKQRLFVRSKVPGASLTTTKRSRADSRRAFGRTKMQGAALSATKSREGREAFGRTKGAPPSM